MAPIRPNKVSKTPSRRSRSLIAVSQRPRSLDDPYAVPHKQNKAFTKINKRSTRHAALLSRLQHTVADSRIKKRRRPNKKLATDLADLADVLPEKFETNAWTLGGHDDAKKAKRKSLKTRPGAMKKKEKLMIAERDRFAKNLALLTFNLGEHMEGGSKGSIVSDEDQKAQLASTEVTSARHQTRWTAIREHILKTIETKDDRPTPIT